MSDHDMNERLRSWTRSSIDPTAPAGLRRQVLAIPTAEPTTQRRRWIRLLTHSKPTAGAEAQESSTRRSMPPTPTYGGTRPMLSVTKLAGIAAAMALFSVFWLVAPLNPPEVAQTPAAAITETGEIERFTGRVTVLDEDVMADAEHFDWGSVKLGEQWTMRWEMSDPRISGITTLLQNVHEYGATKRRVMAETGRLFTRDTEGTWLVTGMAYQDPETTAVHMQIDSVGEGAYEGLFALSSCDQQTYSVNFECEGVILAASPPEAPSAPPPELPAKYGAP